MSGLRDLAQNYVTCENLDVQTQLWMKELVPYCWRPTPPLERQSAALLVVDMNRPFVEEGLPMASANARAVLPRIAELVEAFRRVGRPVIWVMQGHHSVAADRGRRLAAWWPTPILEGGPDMELAPGLAAAGGEKIIHKRRYSGFYQTDLELTLRCLGVEQVVIAGVYTNVCPYATAMDAFMRDLAVYYPPDATAAVNRDLHLAGLKNVAGWCGHVTPTRQIIPWLNG